MSAEAQRRKGQHPKRQSAEERQLAHVQRQLVALRSGITMLTRTELIKRWTTLRDLADAAKEAREAIDAELDRGMSELEQREVRPLWKQLAAIESDARVGMFDVDTEEAKHIVLGSRRVHFVHSPDALPLSL
jgi:protein subunit release factor A